MDNTQNTKEPMEFDALRTKIQNLKAEIGKVLIGQEATLDLLVISVLANGHVLLEGVPGIAKTLMVKLLARTLSTQYSRIQFTPDLMPSDVTGTSVFNMSNSKFEFNKGPIFSNLVLIDEINRAPAKTQAALFEVMEERQVTVDGTTYPMDTPFLVMATQNPLEHEGTYRLPEAQLDRFLFKLVMDYPNLEQEQAILNNADIRKAVSETEQVEPMLSEQDIIDFQKIIHQVKTEAKVMQYIAEIVTKTRNHPSLYLGASPRASINILYASKAYAAVQGRTFIIPEDIKAVATPVLIHRIYTTPEKEMEGVTELQIITDIINSVEVPR